jgi:hypothetical protein
MRPWARKWVTILLGAVTLAAVIAAAVVIHRPVVRERQRVARPNLQQLRNAIGLYCAATGQYPPSLDDLLKPLPPDCPDPRNGRGAPTGGKPCLITPNRQIPANPVSGGNAAGVDWIYDSGTGAVHGKGLPRGGELVQW